MRLAHLLAASLLLAATTAQAATLAVTPDQGVYQVGDFITLNVVGDAEGAADFAIAGRLLFDPGLAEYVSSNQVTLMASEPNLSWSSLALSHGEGIATAFNQITAPFGSPSIPADLLSATVVLRATGAGVLPVSWSIEEPGLLFFGLADAPGTSVTIVPEPSAFTLVALGLTLTAIGCRARKWA
jgi:hypothetical protein